MADVQSLYPQPQAPQQGILSGDPSKVVGLIGALNQSKLFNATFDAASQQPAATLQQTQIANDTAILQQQALQRGIVGNTLSGLLGDDPNPTSDAVHRVLPAVAVMHPNVPASTINAISGLVLNDPKGIKHGLMSIRGMNLSASEASGRVAGPATATGAKTEISPGAANLAGSVQIEANPGVTEAAKATGLGAGTMLNDARSHSLNYRQQVFPLEAAISALEKLGKTGTGPGTEEFNHIKSFLQSAGIPGFDANKIKDFDEAKKYLTDFVNQNGNAQSVEHLRSAFGGSPSTNISNAAASEVSKTALALRRMKEAQIQDFEKSGLPDSDFAKRAGYFARTHDPRAYGFDMMTVEQRRKVLSSLPVGTKLPNGEYLPGTRQHFQQQVQEAHERGIIKTPAAEK